MRKILRLASNSLDSNWLVLSHADTAGSTRDKVQLKHPELIQSDEIISTSYIILFEVRVKCRQLKFLIYFTSIDVFESLELMLS